MAALNAPRSTVARSGDMREFPVKAGAKIWQGALVAIDATGHAVAASEDAAQRVIGRADETADNTAGADGAIRCRARVAVFRWNNSTGVDEIVASDIGGAAFAVDDQTVAKTSASDTRPVAGVIFDVDADGVWIKH